MAQVHRRVVTVWFGIVLYTPVALAGYDELLVQFGHVLYSTTSLAVVARYAMHSQTYSRMISSATKATNRRRVNIVERRTDGLELIKRGVDEARDEREIERQSTCEMISPNMNVDEILRM